MELTFVIAEYNDYMETSFQSAKSYSKVGRERHHKAWRNIEIMEDTIGFEYFWLIFNVADKNLNKQSGTAALI